MIVISDNIFKRKADMHFKCIAVYMSFLFGSTDWNLFLV